ncbi:MAG TPA: AI-2E family transporter [Actinomycetota bacterium]|nr:AI-2E family transporter [Actinomycetota bacterium]
MAARAPERLPASALFRNVFVVAAAGLLIYCLYLLRSLLMLVFIALFLAVGMDPAIRRLQGWGMKRGQAVGVILLAIVGFLAAFFATVVPPLVEQVTEFATNLPQYVRDLAQNNERVREYVAEQDIAQRLQDATQDIPAQIGSSFGTVLGVAGSVLASIFNALTVLVLTIYFSLSFTKIREGSLRLIPQSKRERVQSIMDPILTKIGGYIAGNVVISIVAGVVSFAFLAIAGVPFPVALALWVAIADLIPLVGATLGAVPAVVVAFFDSFTTGIATLAFFVVYQQLENYVVAPRVMTKAVDLSPAAVLVAALAGGSLLGVPGVLMAIPAAAAIKLIASEIVVPWAERS